MEKRKPRSHEKKKKTENKKKRIIEGRVVKEGEK